MNIKVQMELRPCLVRLNGIKRCALFHTWCKGTDKVTGLVELQTGNLCFVVPQAITFLDTTDQMNDLNLDK